MPDAILSISACLEECYICGSSQGIIVDISAANGVRRDELKRMEFVSSEVRFMRCARLRPEGSVRGVFWRAMWQAEVSREFTGRSPDKG